MIDETRVTAFERHLRLRRGMRPASCRAYRSDVDSLMRFLDDRGTSLDDLDIRSLRSWL